jgi:hypothetical protein
MSTAASLSEHLQSVWRYMSFGRFLWLIQNNRLWLSRADLLGDEWEMSLAGEQLRRVIARHPITPLSETSVRSETALERSTRIINNWRRTTFVNCWSASEHESHALWRVFCPSVEAVAIQATLAGLRSSVGLPVHRVTYEIPGSSPRTPTREDLITKKRPMFDYERELRIVHVWEDVNPDNSVTGYALEWHPERWIQSIRVHPEADEAFAETVVKVVEQYAHALKEHVRWSAMMEPPPF